MATISRSFKKSNRKENSSVSETKINGARGGNGAEHGQRVTFLFDASGSMSSIVPSTNQTRLAVVSEAGRKVIDQMNDGDTLTVNLFADRVVTINSEVPKEQYDANAVVRSNGSAGVCTALWSALWATTEAARRKPELLHQLVVFTDGAATDDGSSSKSSMVQWLGTKPANFKIYFITSELSASDRAVLTSLPTTLVKLIELNVYFTGADIIKAFGDVSTRVKQSYYAYVSRQSKQFKESTQEETQKVEVDPNAYKFLTEMARIHPSSAPLAMQLGMSLTQQAVAVSYNQPPPPPVNQSRAIKGSSGQRRLAGNAANSARPQSAPRALLQSAPTQRERKWAVTSDKAGYAIMQAKHLNVEATFNVKLTIPPAPKDRTRVIRQEWIIAGTDIGQLQGAYEELDRIVGSLKGRVRA